MRSVSPGRSVSWAGFALSVSQEQYLPVIRRIFIGTAATAVVFSQKKNQGPLGQPGINAVRIFIKRSGGEERVRANMPLWLRSPKWTSGKGRRIHGCNEKLHYPRAHARLRTGGLFAHLFIHKRDPEDCSPGCNEPLSNIFINKQIYCA